MDKREKYNEESAKKRLKSVGCIVTGKGIYMPPTAGLKAWGAADFLCKVHGYHTTRTQ